MSAAIDGMGRRGPRSVVDQVADEVLRRILTGELVPGSAVAISTLSEQLAVSHVPVREALRTMEARGLITFQRGHRPRVSPVHLEDFEDVFRLRLVLEGEAAGRGVPSAEGLPELEEALHSFQSLLIHGETLAVHAAHTRLHSLMLPAASRWERRFLSELWFASERYIQLFLESITEQTRVDFVSAPHAALVQTVKSADPGLVRQAVIEHVEASRASLAGAVRRASAHREAG
jgi:DNA-binding GntR family transcriptional regulator